MSLKALHIVFIAASSLLTFGLAAWAFNQYSVSKATADLVYGIGSSVCGVALLVYGRYFFKKLKNISYL